LVIASQHGLVFDKSKNGVFKGHSIPFVLASVLQGIYLPFPQGAAILSFPRIISNRLGCTWVLIRNEIDQRAGNGLKSKKYLP
jgi:hypothetical protein